MQYLLSANTVDVNLGLLKSQNNIKLNQNVQFSVHLFLGQTSKSTTPYIQKLNKLFVSYKKANI